LISPYLEQASRIDEKFCYGLLGETGVCVVPLSGFNTEYNWFRMTLLEESDDKFEKTLNIIDEYTKNLVS
jgi:aspartate/methionine/tyrosine aminotransferase